MGRSIVRLKDIADKTGFSTNTVSLALRESPRIPEPTRLLIRQAATELNYLPNQIAKSLVSRETRTIGLVLTDITNPTLTRVAQAIEVALSERGYGTLFATSNNTLSEEMRAIAMFRSRQVDGMLIYPTSHRKLDHIRPLRQANYPIVLLVGDPDAGIDAVCMDERRGAYKASRHLIDMGHRRILHLAGRSDGFNGSQRLAGYRAALQAAGLAFDESLVLTVGYDPELAATALADYLQRLAPGTERPTAVFAATLVTAAGALRTLHQCGFELPRDFSVIALNDGLLASLVFPQLTTVALHSAEMGSRAAAMLIDQIVDNQQARVEILQPGELVVRGSVAPPPDLPA